eukprot:5376221-Prorocentrum_lima.AAC.1
MTGRTPSNPFRNPKTSPRLSSRRMGSGTATTAILERARSSASAVSSCWSIHLSVGTAMPKRPGEVKSSALRT